MPRSEERTLVEGVLDQGLVANVWTANCDLVIPFTPQEFQLGAILPAIIYMFRWGKRRGSGAFLKTYPSADPKVATVASVAKRLAENEALDGFSEGVGQGLLADLLLCFSLENIRHSPAHDEKLLRVYPTHYFSSWVDLPKAVSHLRRAPEGVVAILAGPGTGRWLEPGTRRTRFPLAAAPAENLLLGLFSRGVIQTGDFRNNRSLSDQFSEKEELGLDQLLAVRMAQQLGEAPAFATGSEGPGIPARQPISEYMNRVFREDFTSFVAYYGQSLPRLALIPMLEAALSVGLTTIYLSCADLSLRWDSEGKLLPKAEQAPVPLFIDSSAGVDPALRNMSEQVMNQVQLRLDRMAVAMMSIRILDQKAARDMRLGAQAELRAARENPVASEWLNLLGDLAHERHPRAEFVSESLHYSCLELADRIRERFPDVSSLLEDLSRTPIRRLSEALCTIMTPKLLQSNYAKFLDSTMNTAGSAPLGSSRRVRDDSSRGAAKTRFVRSVILSDPILDYLVHRHLLRNGSKMRQGGLSFGGFLKVLQERYGFYVDKAPPGVEVSAELLRHNRDVLERRLRDLGLLIGVNDAESMKRLRARFTARSSQDSLSNDGASLASGAEGEFDG